jgi:hypothetical protein
VKAARTGRAAADAATECIATAAAIRTGAHDTAVDARAAIENGAGALADGARLAEAALRA